MKKVDTKKEHGEKNNSGREEYGLILKALLIYSSKENKKILAEGPFTRLSDVEI